MKKQVEVSLLDADRVEQRLVGSMNQADTNRVLKAVYPGALVMGTVRKVPPDAPPPPPWSPALNPNHT